MYNVIIMTYSQQDSRWSGKRLGKSIFFCGGSGCAAVATLQGLTDRGLTTKNPGEFIDDLNAIGGFTDEGLLIWDAVRQLFPGQIAFVKNPRTSLNITRDDVTDINVAISEIKSYIAKGYIVLLSVDLSPRNGINQGDHFVLASLKKGEVTWSDGIKDPWYGTETTLLSPTPDMPNGYGAPERSIYGYVVLKVTTPPVEKPLPYTRNKDAEQSNALVLQAELYKAFAPYDKARAYAGGNWPVLVNAITYYGYTVTDVVNYCYAVSRGKKAPFNLLKHK